MNTPRHIALLSPAVGTGNIGDHLIERAVRRLLSEDAVYHRFSIRRGLRADEIAEVNQTSCALICGTNLYQHDWESALTSKMLEQLKVPLIPFGVGGSAAKLDDTYVGDETRSMIRAIHRHCTLGSVRDPHGLQVVTRAGVANVALTGCPVLFWAGNGHLPRVEPRPAKRRLIITARNWLMHRWPDAVDHPVQVELLRHVLDRFSNEAYVFAVHEDFDRRLVETLQVPADSVIDTGDPQDYIRLYTDPGNAVFAMRLHAGMLARANGLPTVFVGHDTRTYSFCQMMGFECIDLFANDCVDRCIEALERAVCGGAPPSDERSEETFARLRAEMDRFIAANDLPPRRRRNGQEL